MKRKKTLVLITMVLFVFVLVVSGCGEKEGTNTTATSTQPSTVMQQVSSTENTKLDPVELNLYGVGDGQPAETGLVEQKLNELLAPKINATVKINILGWGDFTQKINVLFAAGEPIDICFAANWMDFQANTAKGYYAELNDLLTQYAPEFVKNTPKFQFEPFTYNGKIYAVPACVGYVMPEKVVMREDFINKYQIPLKLSFDELIPYLEKIKDGEKGVTPFFLNRMFGASYYADLFIAGYYPVGNCNDPGWKAVNTDGTMKVVNQFELPVFKNSCKWSRTLVEKGLCPKDASTRDFDTTAMKEGKYAAVFMCSGGPRAESTLNSLYGPTYTWKALDVGFPIGIYGDFAGSSANAIGFASKNKERAMMLINLLQTDKEIFNTIALGVEGKHWIKVNGDRWDYPQGVDPAKLGWTPTGAGAQFGNVYNQLLFKDQDENAFNEQRELDASSPTEPALGFVYDPTDIKRELNQCQNVWNELGVPLTMGALDVDKFIPEFIEKLKAAGVEKIIADKQKQLNDYLKTQKK